MLGKRIELRLLAVQMDGGAEFSELQLRTDASGMRGSVWRVAEGASGGIEAATGSLVTLSVFLGLMGLGVWYVFRKRGRIYI